MLHLTIFETYIGNLLVGFSAGSGNWKKMRGAGKIRERRITIVLRTLIKKKHTYKNVFCRLGHMNIKELICPQEFSRGKINRKSKI